jgi:hypothetical protein
MESKRDTFSIFQEHLNSTQTEKRKWDERCALTFRRVALFVALLIVLILASFSVFIVSTLSINSAVVNHSPLLNVFDITKSRESVFIFLPPGR